VFEITSGEVAAASVIAPQPRQGDGALKQIANRCPPQVAQA